MTRVQIPGADSLHCEVSGEGRPLLLLHGFGASIYSWRNLIPEIPPGYRAYAIDLKGFGKSPKPADSRYSVDDQANLIMDFIARKNLRSVSLIGHSMGGGIAILTALKLMDNGQQVSSIVLIDAIAFPQKAPAFISFLRTPIVNWMGVNVIPPDIQVRAILKLAYYDDSKITQDEVEAYAYALRQPGGRQALITTAAQIIPKDTHALTERYRSLRMPALVLWGREDAIVPLQIGNRLHSALPNSTLRIIESSGHIPHEEVPERSIKLIVEFLERNLAQL
jgi:pimeloyl-ACP methyl ester carboxylesterase